ncbi:MAG: ADP-ribosylglycohydrolase family protein [Chloroflexota bacterium]
MPTDAEIRLQRARTALEGLSVGDALGEAAMRSHYLWEAGTSRGRFSFTDDTNMALSVYAILREHGTIDQSALAASFARYFDIRRGYGGGVQRLLRLIGQGADWRSQSRAMFGGSGSFGNGAAMRVAPLGAYFAEDLYTIQEQAERSAVITHSHEEGIAGAVAVAVAAGIAWQLREDDQRPDRSAFIEMILPYVPDSEVKSGIRRARDINPETDVSAAAGMLGNGSQISAMDTVPFTLWCAGEQLDDYAAAFHLTASVGGDVDTNCAIVGGIVASFVGQAGIPAEWINHREPLPDWPFGDTDKA